MNAKMNYPAVIMSPNKTISGMDSPESDNCLHYRNIKPAASEIQADVIPHLPELYQRALEFLVSEGKISVVGDAV